MLRLTKKKRAALEVGVGAGLVVGMTTIGIVIGAFARNVVDKLRKPITSVGFGEDPVTKVARRL